MSKKEMKQTSMLNGIRNKYKKSRRCQKEKDFGGMETIIDFK